MVMVVGGDSVGSRGQLDLYGATRHHAVAGLHTAFILMVELGETCSHLAASRARCCDDDERSGSLNILILAVSLISDDLSVFNADNPLCLQRHILIMGDDN